MISHSLAESCRIVSCSLIVRRTKRQLLKTRACYWTKVSPKESLLRIGTFQAKFQAKFQAQFAISSNRPQLCPSSSFKSQNFASGQSKPTSCELQTASCKGDLPAASEKQAAQREEIQIYISALTRRPTVSGRLCVSATTD